nr:DUF3991 and TOPRIM domain-containing protein [Spartinivicinus marinus]
MPITATSPYLIKARLLSPATLGHPRFFGRIRQDTYANAVFPHFDQSGVTGYEIKNRKFTGFSSAGTKSLWVSHCKKSDKGLVIAESAIDALSHFECRPSEDRRYLSTGGKLNPNQKSLIQAAIKKMPKGALLIAAYDNDKEGEGYYQQLKELNEGWCSISWDKPPVHDMDWNEMLQSVKSIGQLP